MCPVGPLVIHSCHSLEALLSGSVRSESGSTREKEEKMFSSAESEARRAEGNTEAAEK